MGRSRRPRSLEGSGGAFKPSSSEQKEKRAATPCVAALFEASCLSDARHLDRQTLRYKDSGHPAVAVTLQHFLADNAFDLVVACYERTDHVSIRLR